MDYSGKFRERFYAHPWALSGAGSRSQWPMQLAMSAEMMLDTAQPMYILWGPRKTILFNEAYARVLGKLADSAQGAPLPDLWAAIWPTVGGFIDEVYSGKGGLAEDVPLETWATGTWESRFYSFSYTPLKGTDGEVLGAIILCTDTTERVQRVRDIVHERNKLLSLFNEAPSFMAAVEGPQHIFHFANDAYLNLVDRSDLIGKSVAEAFPEIGPELIQLLDHVFLTGERVKRRREPLTLTIDLGPAIIFVDVIFEPMRNDEGVITGILIQGQDYTKEVAAEKQVHLLETKLIHLSRLNAMGAMAATLAHELNQPLAAIVNYAAGAENLLGTNISAVDLAYPISEIRANALRAGEVIRRLREMTKKGEIAKQPFLPDPIVREAGELASVGACAGINLQYEFYDGELVMGDSIQIQQVMINLIRNACDAVAAGADPYVLIRTALHGNSTIVTVEDNGPGIPPEELPNLFDAFFTTKREGMGVGLSISRTIIEAHDGRIWAENRPEGGARFLFTLPLANPTNELNRPALSLEMDG